MADADALKVSLSHNYTLTAAGIRRERNGNISADLILQNGRFSHADRGILNSMKDRAKWASTASGEGRPSTTEIEDALMLMLDGSLSQLQQQPAKATQADQLVNMVMQQSSDFTADVLDQVDLFHTPDSVAYATFSVDGHRETYPVKSNGFKAWARRLFYERHEKTPSAQAVQDALGVLEGKALFDGQEHAVFVRVAPFNGCIYIDLANDVWQVVKISPAGWEVVSDPPVRFRRARGMLPLPIPVPGGSVELLRPFVNVVSDDDWTLLRSWLVAALRPVGPYPILPLHGEQGSAKSTTARALRSLIDPNSAPLRAEPRDGRDLVIAARNSWVLCFDNLSNVPSWLSDALCRLSTGGGFATRELYSDDAEVIFDACRPTILTGIEELATRGDLLDRSLIVSLPSIPESKRRAEATFWSEFDRLRPQILGSLYTAVADALSNLPSTRLERLPRLADFALWATAAEKSLGIEPGGFVAAYDDNRADANDLALEVSPVVPELLKIIDDPAVGGVGGWEGTAQALLGVLDSRAGDGTKRLKSWPKTPRALSGAIRRLAPNLRRAGIDVMFERTSGTHSQRIITFLRTEAAHE